MNTTTQSPTTTDLQTRLDRVRASIEPTAANFIRHDALAELDDLIAAVREEARKEIQNVSNY